MMRSIKFLWLVLFLALLLPGTPGSKTLWKKAAPGHAWEFPRDLHHHPDYKTEWWYITGQLLPDGDEYGEPIGFQFTFFRSGLATVDSTSLTTAWEPVDLIMGHAAVSDPASGQHTFSEVIRRTTPFLGGFGGPDSSVLAWCRAPAGTDADWSLSHQDGVFHIVVRDDARGLRYELECRPTRAKVFHGEDGYSPKSAQGDAGSLYFSQTRMETHGILYREGQPVNVRGESWLDREIFTSTLASNQKGWDWAALRLTDGRDLMLYQLRDATGKTDFALGTLADGTENGASLPASAWNLEPQEFWTSPTTGSRYPVVWKLTLQGETPWRIAAAFPEQENVSTLTGIHYWEGSVTVQQWEDPGQILGRGFVELTGYGPGSRPPI